MATHRYLWDHIVLRSSKRTKYSSWFRAPAVDPMLCDLVTGLKYISRDPERARWIRHLSVQHAIHLEWPRVLKRIGPSRLWKLFDPDNDKVKTVSLLVRTLSRTVGLSHLDLSSVTCLSCGQLSDAITPSLVSGSLNLSFLGVPFRCLPYIRESLTHHPSIRHLLLSHPMELVNIGTMDMPPLPPNVIPHLETLAVPACNLVGLTNGRPLRSLQILGAPPGYPLSTPWYSESMLRGFQAIGRTEPYPGLSHLELPFAFISEFIRDNDEPGDDISALSRHLGSMPSLFNLRRLDISCAPHVRFPDLSLVLLDMSDPDWLNGQGDRGSMSRLMRALGMFRELVELRWNCRHANAMKESSSVMGVAGRLSTIGEWDGFAKACIVGCQTLQRVYINEMLVLSR